MMARRRIPWTLEMAKRRREFYDLSDAKLRSGTGLSLFNYRVLVDEGQPIPLDEEIIQ